MKLGGAKSLSPGQVVKLEVSITISILLVIGVVLLTLGFYFEPTWRPTIEFFGAAIGVAAGILSAYYIGGGLRITIEQRDSALSDERISRAFAFAERWNAPTFAQLREDWRKLLNELDGKQNHEACKVLLDDPHKQTVAADVLNFFEEIAYAVKSGVADGETLKKVHRSIVVRYYSTISPWIESVRRDQNQPSAYEHLEWLKNQWK
jgi:hypothetical protein